MREIYFDAMLGEPKWVIVPRDSVLGQTMRKISFDAMLEAPTIQRVLMVDPSSTVSPVCRATLVVLAAASRQNGKECSNCQNSPYVSFPLPLFQPHHATYYERRFLGKMRA